jgi:hypothetical protein
MKIISKFSGFLMLFIMVSVVSAQTGQMAYTTYIFTDNLNNKVVTTAFNLAKKILSNTYINLDIELDNITVAPIDGSTGASRPQRQADKPFEKTRGQVILGLEQGFGPSSSLAVNLYRSQEVDYISNSIIGVISQDMFMKNTTLTLRGQVNEDKVGKIQLSGSVVNRDKRVFTGAVILTQLLSSTTVLNLYYDAVYMEGYLSDPYRQVLVLDSNNETHIIDELHPQKRLRQAATGKINQLLPGVSASLSGNYRYYFDDWEVKSHMLELKFDNYIFSDLIFGISYRYYTQTNAFFYRENYEGDQYLGNSLRSDDYKLKPFTSNNYGITLRYLLRGLIKGDSSLKFLQNSSLKVTYFRYVNDLDFTANIIQGSINFSI